MIAGTTRTNDATGTSEAAVDTTQGTMAMGAGVVAGMAAVIAAVAIRIFHAGMAAVIAAVAIRIFHADAPLQPARKIKYKRSRWGNGGSALRSKPPI